MPSPSPTPRPPPLRIAVLGGGRIGSAVAFQLVRTGGHTVTVIARPGSVRLAQLARDQAVVEAQGARATVTVADRLDPQTPYDLLLVTLLAHQAEPLLPDLRRSAAGCVLFLCNTFAPERLEAALGADRCRLGMPFIQSMLDADGRLSLTVGAGGQKTLINDAHWVEVFRAAGLPATLEPRMPSWLRAHAPLCAAFESVSVAGRRRGGGAAWREAMVLARGVRAAFTVIRALGYDVYPKSKQRLEASPVWTTAALLWGLSRLRPFRELLATGEAECRALVDAMVRAAPRDLPAPVLARLAAMTPAED